MKRLLLSIIIVLATTYAAVAQSGLSSAVLSPNPVEDKTDLVFEQGVKEDLTIVIKDLTGKTVYSARPDMNGEECYRVPLDLENLRRGIYILQVMTAGGKTKTLKFQKT